MDPTKSVDPGDLWCKRKYVEMHLYVDTKLPHGDPRCASFLFSRWFRDSVGRNAESQE
jgi:hypothetical protein